MNFKGYRYPKDLILLSVRWYLRYSLSYRDLEEILKERGLGPDHSSVYRWVQTFTPEDAAVELTTVPRGPLSMETPLRVTRELFYVPTLRLIKGGARPHCP